MAFLMAQVAASNAAIIVVSPTESTPGSLEITNDITFTISVPGATVMGFVLDDWIEGAEGTRSSFFSGISYSINGAGPYTTDAYLLDSMWGMGELTASDGLINVTYLPAVFNGNALTLKAGSYVLPPGVSLLPQVNQVFTGNMFVVSGDGIRISSIETAAVPEPAAAALLLGGVASAVVFSRRRKRES